MRKTICTNDRNKEVNKGKIKNKEQGKNKERKQLPKIRK
jgi:hypothetical protein